MEVIKRYENNRKYYSTTIKKYVNLAYIIDLVKTDQRFTVVNATDKKDITDATLSQALVVLAPSESVLKTLIKSL